MKLKQLATSFILIIFVFAPASLNSQDNAFANVAPTKIPPTLPVLYRHFLAYQLHLERRADALKEAGKDGEDLRTHYQKKLGFSNQDFAKLHVSALHLEKALAEKDAEAQRAIKDARAAVPKGPLPTGWRIPPPPPRLKELQAEREAIIDAEVETVHKNLTSAQVAKLETFLQKDFAPTVTIDIVPPPFPKSQPSLLPKEGTR